MNESGRKVIALVLCVVSAAGAIASLDYAWAHGGVWTFNVVGLAVLSAVFLAIALMEGAESGSSSRTNNVHTEVHLHGQGFAQQAYQPQPAYYQPPPAPPAPTYVMMPSAPPAPAAPQIVMMTPEMFAQLTGQHAGPGAPRALQGFPVPPGQATQPLLQAPDGRYIAAPYPEGQRLLPAPAPQPARQGMIRRLLS